MKFLKITGIILFVLVALFLIVAAFLPKQFHVEQSIVINRPSEYPFNEINTLRNWQSWSPFDDEDPDMVTTYEGPASGLGAISMWVSETQGNGSMMISESAPFSKIVTDLDFGENGLGTGYFTFSEENNKTKVAWGMDFNTSYPVERVVFAIMKGAMEEMFMKGLKSLKQQCESIAYNDDMPHFIETAHILYGEKPTDEQKAQLKKSPQLYVLQLNERWIATIMDSCGMDEMETVLGNDFGELMPYIAQHHQEDFGNPFTLWHSWDEKTMFGSFEAGVSIKSQSPEEGRIKVRRTKPVKVVAGIHYGPYDQTMYMYEAIQKYMKDHNMEEAGGPIELYVTDPGQEPDPNKWETVIMFQVK